MLLNSGVLVAATPPPTPSRTASSVSTQTPVATPASLSASPTQHSAIPHKSPSRTAVGTPSGSPTPQQLFHISTVAGTGVPGFNGDGFEALQSQIYQPQGAFVAANGDITIADTSNQRVRFVSAATHVMTTIAGTGTAGYNSDGIAATNALLNQPYSVAAFANGDLLIADADNSRIRAVTYLSGTINTIAGTGISGFNGDGISATSSILTYPRGVSIGSQDSVYICESSRIRVVNLLTGLISTVMGTGTEGFNGNGLSATSSQLNWPFAVVFLASGDMLVSDQQNQQIRLVTASTGIVSRFAGTGVAGYNGDGVAASTAQVNVPTGLAVAPNGDVIIGDYNNCRVRSVSAVTGIISTLAGIASGCGFNGDGILSTDAKLGGPSSVSVTDNVLCIADYGGQRLRLLSMPSPTAPESPTPYCPPSLYRPLPRTDLVGDLTGNAWYPGTSLPSPSESACRQACCDAPNCDAYSFAASELRLQVQWSGSPTASCFLYTNVTALVPSSTMSSGALRSVYS